MGQGVVWMPPHRRPCPFSSLVSLGGGSHWNRWKKTTSSSRLGAREVVVGVVSKLTKRTTSGSRLDEREVVVVGFTSKWRKWPPPARVWMQGRWWWWQMVETTKKNHLQLAIECDGGGVVAGSRNNGRNHLQLAFGHEGGGDGGTGSRKDQKTAL